MFKGRFLPLIIVLLLLFSVGCGSKTASTGNVQQKDAKSSAGSIDNTKQQGPPNNAPDMVGKVKTIEGNKLTVYKVNMTNNNRPPENVQNSNISPDERSKPPAQTGNSSQGEPPKPREEMFQVTDETYDLVISADAKIEKGFGRNLNDGKSTQLNIGDIKTGDILGLWFGEKSSDGKQSVKSVQVMQ